MINQDDFETSLGINKVEVKFKDYNDYYAFKLELSKRQISIEERYKLWLEEHNSQKIVINKLNEEFSKVLNCNANVYSTGSKKANWYEAYVMHKFYSVEEQIKILDNMLISLRFLLNDMRKNG